MHIYIDRNPIVVLFPELVSVFQSRNPTSLDLSGKVEVFSHSGEPSAWICFPSVHLWQKPRTSPRTSRRALRRGGLRFARTSPILCGSGFLLQLRWKASSPTLIRLLSSKSNLQKPLSSSKE
ncbi:hypothetical protein U9M48_028520 [Paspalum notatum var. saurae]|uniref:Uncharacterized protein n=1 Tax=Paspalum notatum var. saurae TaxID=547442 RepID=A0AAQ3TVL2_PASNO